MNEIYIYLIGFTLICILVGVLVFILRPKYKSFKEFERYDVIWKWKWRGKELHSLRAYCPKCGNELVYDDEHAKVSNAPMNSKFTFFICHHCDSSEMGRLRGGDRKYAQNLIKNEIYKLIQTEQYKEILDARKRV